MSDARSKRIQKEIRDCAKDKTSQITIEMIDDNPYHLVGAFHGPPDTPYEGGYYEVDIVVPETYPFQPVKMKFITKVYHPNISSASGAICLDILKDAWSPVLTLKSTLISLQSLLCDPAPNDPQDAEGKLTTPRKGRANESVAKHYLTDRASFNKTAKHWAQAYAQAPANKQSREAGKVMTDAEQAGLSEASVVQFTEMGFPREKVISVLKKLNYRGNNINDSTTQTVINDLF